MRILKFALFLLISFQICCTSAGQNENHKFIKSVLKRPELLFDILMDTSKLSKNVKSYLTNNEEKKLIAENFKENVFKLSFNKKIFFISDTIFLMRFGPLEDDSLRNILYNQIQFINNKQDTIIFGFIKYKDDSNWYFDTVYIETLK